MHFFLSIQCHHYHIFTLTTISTEISPAALTADINDLSEVTKDRRESGVASPNLSLPPLNIQQSVLTGKFTQNNK